MALSKSGSAKSGSDAAGFSLSRDQRGAGRARCVGGSREQASLALRELCRGLVPKSGRSLGMLPVGLQL